ncbi:hypothetical protein AAVH_15970 [Aphelenchoides avenae]|nr:hypothetical protein AAVH_15970 [Aphelenchus avenae]
MPWGYRSGVDEIDDRVQGNLRRMGIMSTATTAIRTRPYVTAISPYPLYSPRYFDRTVVWHGPSSGYNLGSWYANYGNGYAVDRRFYRAPETRPRIYANEFTLYSDGRRTSRLW